MSNRRLAATRSWHRWPACQRCRPSPAWRPTPSTVRLPGGAGNEAYQRDLLLGQQRLFLSAKVGVEGSSPPTASFAAGGDSFPTVLELSHGANGRQTMEGAGRRSRKTPAVHRAAAAATPLAATPWRDSLSSARCARNQSHLPGGGVGDGRQPGGALRPPAMLPVQDAAPFRVDGGISLAIPTGCVRTLLGCQRSVEASAVRDLAAVWDVGHPEILCPLQHCGWRRRRRRVAPCDRQPALRSCHSCGLLTKVPVAIRAVLTAYLSVPQPTEAQVEAVGVGRIM